VYRAARYGRTGNEACFIQLRIVIAKGGPKSWPEAKELAESVPWRNECREHDELVFLLCILPAETVEAGVRDDRKLRRLKRR